MRASLKPGYRILVVGDDLDLTTTFSLMLELDANEVRTACSCEAALFLLDKLHFDLIVAEYWLPKMNGEEFAALVRQKRPDQPIILMTANIEDFSAGDGPIAGVDCLLHKPFTVGQLRKAMRWVLDRYPKKQRFCQGLSAAHSARSGRLQPAQMDWRHIVHR